MIKCSSEKCVNVNNGICCLNEIELDRLVCMTDSYPDDKVFYDDYCFECLDYSDGTEESMREKLVKELL